MGSGALAYVAAMTHVRRVPLVAAWLAIAITGLVVVPVSLRRYGGSGRHFGNCGS
jgi:hypothetical protein